MNRFGLFNIFFWVSLAASLLCILPSAPCATYYVATDGDDFGAGTLVDPWLTINHGVNAAGAGDTVYVRGGTYPESVTVMVSGNVTDGYITLSAYSGETPILDGQSLSVVDAMGLFNLRDVSYIQISGFELTDLSSANAAHVPMGIYISGACGHIRITDNLIRLIQNSAMNGNAHGIGVYGDDALSSINDITIDGNEITGCKLGWSESLVLNGNVENFSVVNNIIHHNDNIGIDFIGYEGTCSNSSLDRARDGICSGNTVHHIDSSINPAYGGDTSADGIYVDGGARIVIEQNHVYNCNIGIEAASENFGKYSEDITIRNNFIHDNDIMGIAMGGYDASVGGTKNCKIVHNTLYNNDTQNDGNGEILLQFDTSGITIKNNILRANGQNLLIVDPHGSGGTNFADFNLFFAPGGENASEWEWEGVYYGSFAEWKSGSGNDANSIFSDPLLQAPASGDLHITENSLARDAGTNLSSSVGGASDFDGETRIQNGVVDMGADEYPAMKNLYVDPSETCNGNSPCYPAIGGAIANIDGQMENQIKLREGHYSENITRSVDCMVWIIGGYDSLFETVTGVSSMEKLELLHGKTTLENLAIK